MSNFQLCASCSFGLESIVYNELVKLGFDNIISENGRLLFRGDEKDIARCNLWLRCADRVYIELASFQAMDFEELYQGTKQVAWEDIISRDGKMHVTGRSVRSKLSSVPHCQSIVKKGIIDALKRRYNDARFSETGPLYHVEIALNRDRANLLLDTSGEGLHKRGYRSGRGEAPLRETLAAALVYLSKWDPERIFADPLCGSGTIPIEAALLGKNMAPGKMRAFSSEQWGIFPSQVWETAREETRDAVKKTKLAIMASDSDRTVFLKACENARNAGIGDDIVFQKKALSEFSSSKNFGVMICNPPYGERMGDQAEMEKLYHEMNDMFNKLDTWSFFILTGHEHFTDFFERKPNKNRKLYNGNIKTYFYQFFGPMPKSDRL